MATNQPQSDSDGDGEDESFYLVTDSALGEAQPGDVVTLRPSVAQSFEDNLSELEATDAEAAREEAEEVVQSQSGAMRPDSSGTADFDPEAGHFRVKDSPVGTAEPGEVVQLSPEVAEAFKDNLVPVDPDETESDSDATVEPQSEQDADDQTASEDATADSESSNGSFPGDFASAEEFVDRTPQSEVTDDLETGDYDAYLDAIESAERSNDDRNGVTKAISERREEQEQE